MPPKKKVKTTPHTEGETNSASREYETPMRKPSPRSSNPEETPAPVVQHEESQFEVVSAEASAPSGSAMPSQGQSAGWANLKALLDILEQAAAISGLEPVKSVVKRLVELIGLYEDTAQGRKEYDDLRVQLECIFDELGQHLSSSPVITTSMGNICWSIQKELDLIKAQQSIPKKRKVGDVENDVGIVLKCYRRVQDHLQRLSRNANLSTWKIVDQLATDNRLQKLAPSLWPCYNSEKALELGRGPCTEGTRTSVLAHICQWITSPGEGNIYWMSGMAGTGKTTIAYSLCEQLNAKANPMLCASFFCSRSVPECRDVARIIPSIAYQLARCSLPFRYALSQAMEKDPDAHTRLAHDQFETLILEPLSDVKIRAAFPTKMVVVIDALDECDDVKSTRQILGMLLTKSKSLPIKFVVSSRPEPAIRDQMEKNGTWVGARVVLHELDGGEVQTDIRTYLKSELAQINPTEPEIEQLVARAGVLFIYAATVVRYVGYDDFGRDPQARLDMILGMTNQDEKAPTNDIDDLYATILRAAFDDPMLSKKERDSMKLVLDTVICARAPLTVGALNNLLKLSNVALVHAALRPLWSVLHVMGLDMTVTTLHASFPDYLLDTTRSGPWHCDASAQHDFLAQRCLECIRDTKPQFNICRLESSYITDADVPDLDTRVEEFIPIELRYACQYWVSHLDATESCTVSGLVLVLSQFLTMHLLLWMEVRSLTETMTTTLGELMAAKRWATRHEMSRDAIDLLSDAWRFASVFISSAASQSTPHLYVSMLPLLPSYSSIRKHYYGRFSGLIGAEGTATDRRQDALLAEWKFELNTECMTCSPDGTLVAIGGRYFQGRDGILLVDTLSGNMLLDLSRGDWTAVHSIAFSPDSTRIASGTLNGMISVWDLTNGQPALIPFKAHDGDVSAILFSRDSVHIASASEDKTIRIWDAVCGGRALPPFTGHYSGVSCIAASFDGKRLVSGSRDHTIRVWDIQSGKLLLGPITGHTHEITTIAVSSDDSYIVSGSMDGTIRIWDSKTGQIMLQPLSLQVDIVTSVSISPDNATIVSATYMVDSLQIWNIASRSGKSISQLGPFSKTVYSESHASYMLDGTRVIYARADGVMRVLDTQTTSTASDSLPGHARPITSIDVSRNGRHAVSGSYDSTLCVWDLSEGTLILGPLQGHTDQVNMVRFSPDGGRIISCAVDSTIRQWDAQSGAVHATSIHVPSAGIRGVISATYSPCGTGIVSLTYTGTLSVWDSSNGQLVLGPIDAPGQFNGVCAEYSTDGATVIAGYTDGSIRLWDVQSGKMMCSHEGHGESGVSALAFSPDGLRYAQAFEDGKICLRNIHSGEEISGDFEDHTEYVTAVRFSSDGNHLVSGSRDQTVHIWDVETGRSMFGPLRGHTGWVRGVAFSPNGEDVVSVSDDLAIRVWDAQPRTPSSKDRDIDYAVWALNEEGWMMSGEWQRLFWVPSDLHASLMWPRNKALIYPNDYHRLNIERACIGEAWAGCWGGS